MNENKHDITTANINTPDEPLDEAAEMQAFIARVEAASAHLKTKRDDLLKLYKDNNLDELNFQIDSLTDAIAVKNPEFEQNIINIKQLRNSSNSDGEAVAVIIEDQNRIYATIRSMVIHEVGLPDEVQLDAIEQARVVVAAKLDEAYQGMDYSSHDALTTLGIVGTDSETMNSTYHFPTGLVSDSTNELWETYLAAVCVHVKLADDLAQKKSDDRGSVQEADRTRSYAHDAVTKELHAILDLHPTDAWGYADTRHLLAKVRDYTLPTRESALSPASNKLVEKRFINLVVSSELRSRSD